MAITFPCPRCDTRLRMASAAAADTPVECPKCGTNFKPAIDREKSERRRDDEDEPRARKSRPARDDDDDDDDRPRRRTAAASRRRDDDDDDDDDRPRRSRKRNKQGGGVPIAAFAGGGVVLLLAIGGLAWWLAAGSKPKAPNDVTDGPSVNAPLGTNPQANASNASNVSNANPGELSGDQLARVRKATAFIQVEAGNQGGTGSGFIVRSNGDTAYLVTNHHVIAVEEDEPPAAQPKQPVRPRFGPPPLPRPPSFRPPGFGPRGFGPGFGFPGNNQAQPKPKAKRKVMVVLNSCTPEEQTVPAEVVAVDDEADLAVLRITGVRNLPAALDATQEPPVSETMPVFILGFPGGRHGKTYNPAVTVSKGSIAGLRRDGKNRLNEVQISGELIPGNSGGPVVDARGRLIGVAVAASLDKPIGFAIPTAQLNEMFRGSIRGTIVCQARQLGNRVDLTGEIWLFDHNSKVRENRSLHEQFDGGGKVDPNEFVALARLTDPMLKINAVNLHYALASDPVGSGPLANARKIPLQVNDQTAIATFKLPAGSVLDQTYAFQVSYVNAEGQTIYTQPHLLRLTFKSVKSMTLKVTTPADDASQRYVEATIMKTFSGPGTSIRTSRTQGHIQVEIDPVEDPKSAISRITFGEVVSVEGRTVAVAVKKVELPLPTEAEVATALEDLKSTDHNRKRGAVDRLSKAYRPLPARQADVAKALEAQVADKDFVIRHAALRALTIWAVPENVAGLARLLDTPDHFTQTGIITVIAKYKDPVAAPALAKLLPGLGERGAASAALKAIGPAAEKAVIPYLTHKDSWTSSEACHILQEIGTAESIPPLKAILAGKPDFMVGPAATNALKSIESRKKK
jgi:S1-C subfamily serine protease